MDHYFSYLDTPCYYRTEGEGIAVVLVHGFAEDHSIWNEQVDFLKDHCKLIVPDLPGSGNSSMLPPAPATVSIDNYARYVHAVAMHAGVDRCILLGHSMGGYITLAFAEMYGSRLLGFGLVHSTAFADSDEKKEVRRRAIDTMHQYGSAAFIRSTTPNTFAAAFKNEHPEAVEALVQKGAQFSVEALEQYYTAMMNRPDRTAVLKSSAVPVLFIIGLEDAAVPAADMLKQTTMPAAAHVHTLEGVGHMGMWEAADAVNTFLLQFIQHIEHTTHPNT